MHLLKILTFAFFLLTSSLYRVEANEKISGAEAAVLAPFFKLLLENTEAGYVLLDRKPVCIQAYSENILFEEDFHRLSVSFWGAKKILQRPLFQAHNICFRINPTDEYILIINRHLFLEVVQENLPLFQYVLGPTVTPTLLLEALLDEKNSFNSVFNDDKTLIGIVLGYGVQHSLFVARIEEIMDNLLSQDVPPYQPKAQLCNDMWKEMLLFTSVDDNVAGNKKPLKPSLGFASISEEQTALIEKIELPSARLTDQNPSFIFGCLKEAKGKKKFINDLEATQKKIQTLLHSPSFLQNVLARISTEKITIAQPIEHPFSSPAGNVDLAIAKLLKSQLDDPSSLSIFLSGLEKLENNTDLQIDRMATFPEFSRNIALAKQNIEAADQFFSTLSKDQELTCLSKPYLYCKTLQEGSGRSLNNEADVCVDFEIYDPHGQCLNCEANVLLNLKETIAGLAFGMKGMKIGEKRLLFIHPALAYGVHTHLEKGIYLKVLVRLVEIHDSLDSTPLLTPLDFSFIRSNEFQTECQAKRTNALRYLGMKTAKFLKPYEQFKIDSITASLHSISEESSSLTSEEMDFLNQIFWNHYFAKSEELSAKSLPL